MAALIPLRSDSVSMTSREIADLVGSRHDKVKQSIERLAKNAIIQLPPMGVSEEINSLGLPQRTKLYIFTAETKRDSYIVVAQLSPEFTARLVDRWQELEAQALKPALPDFTNPAEAARAWANEYEHKQVALAQLEAAQPAIEFHARVTQSPDMMTVAEVAKILRTGPRRMFEFLRCEGLLMKSNLPYQNYLDRGLFRVVESTWTDKFGRARVTPKTVVTQKGLQYIQGLQDRLASLREEFA
jgi:phage antirepressor YoqD-like protein